MTENSLVLVTGANGHLGNNLVRLLIGKGYNVRASVRNIKNKEPFRDVACEVVQADMTDKISLAKALQGVETFYAVGAVFKLWAKDPQKVQQHKAEQKKQVYDQLQEKVKNQENELKIRMRYLSQKQELLDSILIEIEAQKKELGDRYPNKLYQRLTRIIQEGTAEKDKFLSFENYFVEVHYEFMLRMQQAHPELSASELKFCCLLRANLSTKEVAVIMGIALRSVELKKYRLKQKLNLIINTSVTGYIFGI